MPGIGKAALAIPPESASADRSGLAFRHRRPKSAEFSARPADDTRNLRARNSLPIAHTLGRDCTRRGLRGVQMFHIIGAIGTLQFMVERSSTVAISAVTARFLMPSSVPCRSFWL